MTAFFIRTDSAVAGPFTGVELREAALAGILGADSLIGGSPQGPWILAGAAGLFSEDRIALPHPPDVLVPQYQVRGMPGAFRGPFKLRELIGFASRGMLPLDALLQSGPDQPWIPVDRLQVLAACLHGELAMIDPRGHVIRRAVGPTHQRLDLTAARAPMDLARSARGDDSTAFASAPTSGAVRSEIATMPPKQASEQSRGDRNGERSWVPLARRVLDWTRHWDAADRFTLRSIAHRALPVIGLLMAITMVTSALAYWKRLPMPREAMIGDWIGRVGAANDSQRAYGIAFRDDGSCVVFNPAGSSWTGDYMWAERPTESQSLRTIGPFTVDIESAEPHHDSDFVRPSDGYIRFTGRDGQMPVIDGHRISDAFVRRESETLRIGYLTRVEFGQAHKSMQAAWLTLQQLVPAIHNRHRIDALAKSVSAMNPIDLLSTCGVPDEARKIYPFELGPAHRDSQFLDAQLIRYADRRWIQSADGVMQTLPSVRKP